MGVGIGVFFKNEPHIFDFDHKMFGTGQKFAHTIKNVGYSIGVPAGGVLIGSVPRGLEVLLHPELG